MDYDVFITTSTTTSNYSVHNDSIYSIIVIFIKFIRKSDYYSKSWLIINSFEIIGCFVVTFVAFVCFTLVYEHYARVLLCNFRSLAYDLLDLNFLLERCLKLQGQDSKDIGKPKISISFQITGDKSLPLEYRILCGFQNV